MAKIVDATFLISAPSIDEAVASDLSEIAILGRSNVGKSSFINSLVNRKNIAKSSSTPGKTRLINFFNITFINSDKKFYARVVDLPGFGYAKVSKSEKKQWQDSLNNFLTQRSSIRVFVHLIDARHPSLDIDINVKEYLQNIKKDDQYIIDIFTKSDKLNQKDRSKLLKSFPNAILVSNLKKSGVDTATQKIFDSLFGLDI
jgi:GTP-binding protein